jgi:hypothetical protein
MYSLKMQSESHKPLFKNGLEDELKKVEDKFDPENLKVEDLENVTKEGKPCFLIKNVLTKEECKTIIKFSESEGYEKAESYCHSNFLKITKCIITG